MGGGERAVVAPRPEAGSLTEPRGEGTGPGPGPAPPHPKRFPPFSPAGADLLRRGEPAPAGARVTRAARRQRGPPAAAPVSCVRGGLDGDGAPPRPPGWRGGRRREGGSAPGARRGGLDRRSRRSALRGTKATRGACDRPQPRRRGGLRLMAKRPSDRRSPGRNPGPQGAFEVSMINVSCNSH